MRIRPLAILVCASAASLVVAGCSSDKQKQQTKVPPKYQPMAKREVPAFLQGSIFEQVNLENTAPYLVSTFGLVTMKNPTGDTANTPNNVREYMLREMTRRGFGSKNQPGFEHLSPEQVLRDPRVAIVRVDAYVPAGAIKGQRVDVQVSALPDSETTSLAGGSLFTCDLAPNGANASNPGNSVDVYATARGYVFVNPAYALDPKSDDQAQRRSLTQGVILNGGRIDRERPLGLRIRAAERRLARMTEYRIDELVGDKDAATAEDEGTVYVRVPPSYRGDWEHYAGVVLHTFYNSDSGFAAMKSRQLAEEAVKPNAPLLDISYTFEALGKPALPALEPLLTHPNHEVAFAAARAAAFIGDTSAESALASMAADAANPFRISAVQTLAALPSAPSINMMLRDMLKFDDALVRVEAYKGLVRNNDNSIFSKKIGDKFILDIVTADSPPLIFASRVGMPRIAFIGSGARLPTPTFFSAMSDQFSISPVEERKDILTLFYRGADVRTPVKTLTTPDLAEIVARLGGEGPVGQPRLDFSYGEIVAILGKMSDANMLVSATGPQTKANFVLQDLPGFNRDVNTAPVIPEGPRPIAATPQEPTTP
jgi:hypothetical protein